MSETSILKLLDDGRCSIQGTCLKTPSEAQGPCPQAFKCGTCVAWSPREENRYGRNSGQCMLNREATTFLDCNAQICPYYRPRRDNPAYEAWAKAPKTTSTSAARAPTRRRSMDREAPPPTPAALAMAAFDGHDEHVAALGAKVLEGMLEATVQEGGPLPVLLERFRGGTARIHGAGVEKSATLEAFYARLVLVRRALDALEAAIDDAPLGDERAKIEKDLAGMGGALTTFNILFKEKSDQFKGQGKA